MFWYGDEGSTSSYGSLINNSDIRGCTLEYSNGRMDIKHYNLLYNVGTTTHQSPCGFVSTWGGTGGCTLCTFLYNNGSKYMFFSDTGSLEIKDCLFDWCSVNNQYISFNGNSKIYNVINMIHTGKCKAEGEPDIDTDASKFYAPGKAPTYFKEICLKTNSCRKNNLKNMVFIIIAYTTT